MKLAPKVSDIDILQFLEENPTATDDAIAEHCGYAGPATVKTRLYRLKNKGFINFHREGDTRVIDILRIPLTAEEGKLKSDEQREQYWEIFYYLKHLLMTENDMTVLNAKTNTAQVAMKALSKT